MDRQRSASDPGRTWVRTCGSLARRRGRPPAQPTGLAAASAGHPARGTTRSSPCPTTSPQPPEGGCAPARGRSPSASGHEIRMSGHRQPAARGSGPVAPPTELQVDESIKSQVERSIFVAASALPSRRLRGGPPAVLPSLSHRPGPAERHSSPGLNPGTFETFVIGSSNWFRTPPPSPSRKPRQSVQPAPSSTASPVSARPTCCTRSATTMRRSLLHRRQGRYVSSEEFTNEFIKRDPRRPAGTGSSAADRDVDVLLIDDIQFPGGQDPDPGGVLPHVQHLHNANKQIVLTSDRAPKRLEALEDRLRNRFEGPDHRRPAAGPETRIAILRKKAAMDRVTAPRTSWSSSRARSRPTSESLEGALIRVTAFANLNRQEVDMTLARSCSRTSSLRGWRA